MCIFFLKHYENTILFVCYYSNQPNTETVTQPMVSVWGRGYQFFLAVAERVSVLETGFIFLF